MVARLPTREPPFAPDSDVQSEISLESLWAELSFNPDPQQRKAICAVAGPLYLTAGPGSGKTSVLVWRTLNLIVFQGVPPEEIFLGTFTEKGAHQLRERLRGLLAIVTEKTGQPYDISKMAIGTIHSICHMLLTDRRLTPPGVRPRAPILLDEFAQYQFIYAAKNWSRLLAASGLGSHANSQITTYFENQSSPSRHRAVVNAMGFFNRMSEESLNVSPRRTSNQIVRALLKMYAAYLELLAESAERSYTDFSLLQLHAYRRVAESPVGDRIFQHVIIDEYQDTNAIQEKLYFRLSSHFKNLCVVGDDDQALYRFRGATVDNFLAFPEQCRELLGRGARRIPLETNYRSRSAIVQFYNAFMREFDWRRGKQEYRVEKTITASSADDRPAVFTATPDSPDNVAAEVAAVVDELIKKNRVRDPNQVAFLFPSLNSSCVAKMKRALEDVGLKVYAPRAGSFIEQAESLKVFGIYLLIFGNPGHQHNGYENWLGQAVSLAKQLVRKDRSLARFVRNRQDQIRQVVRDNCALLSHLSARGLDEVQECGEAELRALAAVKSVSREVREFLRSGRLAHYLREQRKRRPDRAITFRYVINRACSLDWGVLDLFYQLTAFDAFRDAFELPANGGDEGPICNLSLISDYLARFQEQTSPVISAQFLSGGMFARKLFSSFLYSIFRLDEGEYEDKDDPFPKGRIPFLTIHQAKGLEFPVVVLGNLRKDGRERVLDGLVRGLGAKRREPSDLAPTYDVARMFYVALSRAKQALILCPYQGRGQRYREEFRGPVRRYASRLADLDVQMIQPSDDIESTIPHPYSFTGDYIQYSICPRRYMMYRRYGFVPSRSQTTIFGNLVHRTIEDLHQLLMQARAHAGEGTSQ